MTLYTRHVSASGRVSYIKWGAAYEDGRGWPIGHHLVHVTPGCTATRYNVEPTAAPLLAAAREARPRVLEAIRAACQPRPTRPLTTEQARALDGVVLLHLSPSAIYDELVTALVDVANLAPMATP